jgi:putative glutamine amidotransferase
MQKPLIGITLDFEKTGSFSPYPYYALRTHYSRAVAAAGCLPIFFPYEAALIPHYLSMIDGLLVPGGSVDISPALYGEATVHATTKIETIRTDFDAAIFKEALAMQMPILGICAGQQLMNVLFGGTLIQHIPDDIPNAEAHYFDGPRETIAHSVTITPGTLLSTIIGAEHTTIDVNSHHHQAVKTIGKDLIVSAVAPDGVIEAIEHSTHPFCLGIEWHPEFEVTTHDRAIFTAFREAANRYRASQLPHATAQ